MLRGWRDRLQALQRRLLGRGAKPTSLDRAVEDDTGTQDERREQAERLRPSYLGIPADDTEDDDQSGHPQQERTRAPQAATPVAVPRAERPSSPRQGRGVAHGKATKVASPPAVQAKPRQTEKSPVLRTKVVLSPPIRPPAKKASVSINLGIDFGTSFTKVCFRDIGTEESGIVTFGAASADEALIPTVVAIDKQGRLSLGEEAGSKRGVVAVPYLKMRLANLTIGDRLPDFNGIDLNETVVVRALAAWFLAAVAQRCQAWIADQEQDRLKHRNVVWSANVGVPVEHYDSAVLPIFQEVLGVAWQWVKGGQVPSKLSELTQVYKETSVKLDCEISDFHAVPEIAAAVQSFVISREAVPGIYVYFDIGGGTLDGVAFDYINYTGERRINFYSGKLEALGLSALAEAIGVKTSGPVPTAKLDKLLAKAASHNLAKSVQRLVAYVVMTAKFKDGRNWQESLVQHPDLVKKNIGRLEASKMRPLIVFIGGGGSSSSWYRATINATYKDFGHHNAGIPPYQLKEVPKPTDLSMNGLRDDEFRRFAISYGLSIPYGEGPEIRLPSQFDVAERPSVWKPVGVVDYADSKDVC